MPPAASSIPARYPSDHSDPAAAIASALAAARHDGRNVLIDFGADWCPDCVVLNHLYQAPAAKRLLTTRYHLVLVNVGEFNKNLATAARYVDLDTSGIPALAVVEPSGKVVYRSNDGAFANARTMSARAVQAFLRQWSSA